jgi:lipid II:glycine glycyltransferase (peptidoglycan interpeptide bridge formation enzyme)
MLEIERKRYILKTKDIWFADFPYDIKGFSRVAFRDCKNKIDMPGFDCKEHATFVIDLTQDLDEIWNNMGKSSCRYEVRRAEREGIKILIDQRFEEFVKIDKLFRKTKKLQQANITAQFIKKYGLLFVSELGGEIMGGQFYLKDKNNMRLLLAPSKRLNVDDKKSLLIGMGNRLMIWEAIKYGKANGIKEFDFGGYSSGGTGGTILDEPNLFKQSFGGKKTYRYIYQKEYSKIYKFLSFLKRKLIKR